MESMISSCISFTNLPKDVERGQVFREFIQFGEINKLYINSEYLSGKVYFKTQEAAENAYRALQSNSKLNLKLQPPVCAEIHKKLSNTRSESSVSSDSNMMHQSYNNDELIATDGPSLIDAFGNFYTTLQADDGTIYVPIQELNKGGFKFFDASIYSFLDAKLRNDRVLIEQFELYMQVKARKFLLQNKVDIDDSTVKATIERCKNEVFTPNHSNQRLVESDLNNSIKVKISHQQRARSANRDDHGSHKRNQSKSYKNEQNNANTGRNRNQNDNANMHRNKNQNENTNSSRNRNQVPMGQRNFNQHQQFQSRNNPSVPQNVHNRNQSTPINCNRNQPNSFNRNHPGNIYKNLSDNQLVPQLRRPKTNMQRFQDKNQHSGNQNKDVAKNANDWNEKGDTISNQNTNLVQGLDDWESQPSKDDKSDHQKKQDRSSSVLSNRSQASDHKSRERPMKTEQLLPLKQVELKMDEFQEVVVQHVENDRIGWVTLQENEDYLKEITMDVLSEVTGAHSVEPTIGQIYAAEFDEIWFRAVVHSTVPELKVHFIDFGNPNMEPVKELKPLSEKICSLPAQAVRIRLTCPGKMQLEAKLRVKPVAKEEDGTYVTQLESEKSEVVAGVLKTNKFLPDDILIKDISKEDEAKCNSIMSYVTPGETGLLEIKNIVNNETFVAFFVTECYMQDVCNLDEIKVKKSDLLFQPSISNLVAVNYDESFVRGRVTEINGDKYKVALVDYGIILETKDVWQLSDKFHKIPEFSCLCQADPNVLEEIKNCETIRVRVLLDNKLKLEATMPDTQVEKEFEVTATIWDPLVTLETAPPKRYYRKDLPILRLLNNTLVAITAEMDGFLMLRNRESTAKLKEICNYLQNYKAKCLEWEPEIGELLLCLSNKSKLFRVMVTSISDCFTEIHYIDYGNSDTVPLENLRMIDERLANFDNTLLKTKLKGFDSFGEKQLNALAKCKENNEKFTVVFVREDKEIELRSQDGQNLSDRLRQLSTTSSQQDFPQKKLSPKQIPVKKDPIIQISDIPKSNFSMGSHELVCLTTENIGEGIVAFCEPKVEIMDTIQEQITEFISTNPTAYRPQELEMVLGYYEDDWFRATNLNVQKDGQYNLLFVDYGNCLIVGPEHIRKFPQKLSQYPSMARFCCLKGLKHNRGKLLERLQELIVVNESYEVEFVGKEDDDLYTITIPSVMKTLQCENLI